jgi:hypothetical protein
LAGGSWKVVRAMIYDIFDNQPYHTLICKKPESNWHRNIHIVSYIYEQYFKRHHNIFSWPNPI